MDYSYTEYYRKSETRRQAIKDSNKRRKQELVKELTCYKLSSGCARCGYKICSAALEFHHFDDNKEFTIAKSYSQAREKIWEEVAKCIVLCANCHREEHFNTPKEIHVKNCVDCDKQIDRRATRCKDCDKINRPRKTKVEWPPNFELQEMVNKHGFVGTGKKLGVSDNAVRKRLTR